MLVDRPSVGVWTILASTIGTVAVVGAKRTMDTRGGGRSGRQGPSRTARPENPFGIRFAAGWCRAVGADKRPVYRDRQAQRSGEWDPVLPDSGRHGPCRMLRARREGGLRRPRPAGSRDRAPLQRVVPHVCPGPAAGGAPAGVHGGHRHRRRPLRPRARGAERYCRPPWRLPGCLHTNCDQKATVATDPWWIGSPWNSNWNSAAR